MKNILPAYRIQAEAEAEEYMRHVDHKRRELRQACHRANNAKDTYTARNAIQDADNLRDELKALHVTIY